MFGGSKAETNQMTARVDHVAHKDTRGDDFCIGTLFLIQVPRTTDSQEITRISRTIDDQNNQI